MAVAQNETRGVTQVLVPMCPPGFQFGTGFFEPQPHHLLCLVASRQWARAVQGGYLIYRLSGTTSWHGSDQISLP